jgi:hypothetical protein
MKLLIVFVFLASLFSNGYSLGLTIATLVGNTAVVQWTREAIDPDPLTVDLRFVIPPYCDVGLAKASVYTSSTESSGNITVQFPDSGRYMLVAVSGRNNFQFGRSAAIEVPGTLPTPSQTPAPSQTPTPPLIPPSPSKSFMATETSCPKKKLNVPAIVFAVLGGVALIAVLIFAVFYFRRRRAKEDKRISFHRERMVQQRSSDSHNPSAGRGGHGSAVIPYAFTGPRASLGSTTQSSHEARPHDIEQGLAVLPPILTSLPRKFSGSRPNTPLASGHVVPPPRGPRDRAMSVRRVESPRVARVNSEPTSRQRQLANKLVEVEKQILEVKSQPKPLPSTVVLLEDLEMQKAWLVKQRDSMWALEEIDTVPPGYSRFMN